MWPRLYPIPLRTGIKPLTCVHYIVPSRPRHRTTQPLPIKLSLMPDHLRRIVQRPIYMHRYRLISLVQVAILHTTR